MRVWQTIDTPVLTRHSHDEAYAAVVLSGGYEEAGDQGRFRVEAGDVILHDRFEAHLNRLPGSMAVVLNLPLPPGLLFAPGAAQVADPDEIVRSAERDRTGAVDLLLLTLRARRSIHGGWPDELATTLIEDPCLVLTTWAEQQRLTPWSVSRGFADVFGVSPEAFRARSRARRAWKAIQMTAVPLAQIACESGFADQSHMSRSVKQLTGATPFGWRHAANGFKTQAPSGR
jgi:AraC-like DNA-binding protein